ncbi:hypothetical protein SKAU_G00339850 [Synaphobranchus kaupii]|uniref:Uncharacterized protein n=1 Tax=Synaphobranchus kaupii TaxID=118154 RepID=A0A9Q1EMV9_SYNKA|nr:hypothetical protein SKAU_G00339850 [Synaphobranchus kaupii]
MAFRQRFVNAEEEYERGDADMTADDGRQQHKNKVDELQANVENACVIALTETWLKDHDLGQDFEIDGFGQHIRLDRDAQLTGKSPGGGRVLVC